MTSRLAAPARPTFTTTGSMSALSAKDLIFAGMVAENMSVWRCPCTAARHTVRVSSAVLGPVQTHSTQAGSFEQADTVCSVLKTARSVHSYAWHEVLMRQTAGSRPAGPLQRWALTLCSKT